jgi:hypothetical protein
MLFFFNWLRTSKGVKRIIKVEVQDLQGNGHSDEAIEKCLAGFHIESLDWQKIDLDPETIYNAAPNLRELTLHWSGNNAVLRGWSEHDGLKRLQDLTDIHLRIQQVGRESHTVFL